MGLDAASTWSNLILGVSGVDYISAFDPEGFDTHIAAEVKGFDPTDYLEKKQARHLDRFAQFAIVATQEALWQAELKLENVDPTRVAVIVGTGIGGILTLSEQYRVLEERGPKRVSPFLLPMMLADMGPGQISMIFGAKGPNFTTVSSCSSGADAIGEASEMIRRGDVDIAIVVDGYAPRHIQFPFLASLNAESTQVFAVFGEFLDAAIQTVDDPYVVVGIKSQAGRSAELAFPISGLAPGAEQVAVGVENGNAVEPLVSDINPFVLIQSDGGKPGKLTLLIAASPELADEVLVYRCLGDPGRSAVGDEQHAVLTCGHSHRLTETHACGGAPAYVVAVLPASAWR